VFLTAEQGRAAKAVFWKNHPRFAPVFFRKTLHRLNTAFPAYSYGNSGPTRRINLKIRISMLQTETKRYSIKALLQLNESYDCDHSLTEWDVAKVNNLVERIESSRSATKPEAGDRLLYTSKHGDYSPVAFIEKNRNPQNI
jgi:hypothetical protein